MMFLHRRLLSLSLLVLLAALPVRAQVVINEIHANPDVKTERVEFIELHNAGAGTVSLAGWRLTDAVEFTFPAEASIAPGGYAVVAAHPTSFQTKFGVIALGPWSGRLSNEGERIRLLDTAGNIADEVSYKLGFPWPTVGDAPGFSIELIHPSLDNDLGGSWRASVSSAAPPDPLVMIPAGATWRYRKGTAEASSPAAAWRLLSFNDASWDTGALMIGYDDALPMVTPLNDMRGNYSSVYLRRTFFVTNVTEVGSMFLDAVYDDGLKIWINGQGLLNINAPGGNVPFNGTATSAIENNNWTNNDLPANPASYLVQGTNILAIQLLNASVGGSSDCYLDVRLWATSTATGNGPTPGRRNAVYSEVAPPQVRQVSHTPNEPRSGQPVVLSAKITDPDGVASVTLAYQVVQPGNYIQLADAAYETTWTSVPMTAVGGDVYQATLPGSIQQHRRLVRYRITATDTTGQQVRTPYADDPQPNFAYFVYDGIPAWSGAVNPAGSGPVAQSFTVSSNEMNRLPAYHLLSKKSSVEDATWFSRYGGDAYLWQGTLVHNGRVYDHIRYRARGGVWRYAMVKNMWKFDFNRGHDLRALDNWHREIGTPWTKLNLGASIQQGDYNHRGEQGMFESVGLRLFQLAGIASPHTAYVQFRVIDEAEETKPNNQYDGDFWGVYLAIEQENGRFLDEHGLPDGNLYKMEGGTGELNNLGTLGPDDKFDLNYLLGFYNGATTAWWRTNLNIPAYLSYQTIVQAIHHYDICDGKNYFYYRNPETGLWQVVPWDLDLTWAENMYRNCGGTDAIKERLIPNANAHPSVWREWQNRVRELRDLLLNEDEGWRLIDEHAGRLRGPAGTPSLIDADRAQWDFNPKMSGGQYSSAQNKAGQGRFYQWPGYPAEVTKDFNGAVTLMKRYMTFRSTNPGADPRPLDTIAADPGIPNRPSIARVGGGAHPVNRLTFRSSNFNGPSSFGSIQWRVGEITKPTSPSHLASGPWKYEVDAVWESPALTSFASDMDIPAGVLRVGRTYRVRVRHMDSEGRASHWSAPYEFTADAPDNADLLAGHLRITELMHNPLGGNANEFIELRNTSPEHALDLAGVRFTQGVTYTFPEGATLAPGAYAVVIQADPADNFAAFRAHYGLGPEVPVFGPWSGNLNNAGETVTLRAALGGPDLIVFEYGDGREWPLAANGPGHSLVPVGSAIDSQPQGSLDYAGHWRASTFIGGSPGAAEPAPPHDVVLNEITAHTDFMSQLDSNDWIELHNRVATNVTLGAGWYLSDTALDLKRWAIPAGTVIPAGGFVVFDEVTGFNNPSGAGFGLSKAGEQVLLSYLPGTAVDRVADAVRFPAEENDWSWGRVPASPDFWAALTPRTRGAANAPLSPRPRITETHYHPAPLPGSTTENMPDEFIEITAPHGQQTAFFNNAGLWRIGGDVAFEFPAGFVLQPGEQVLLVNFSPADTAVSNAFRARFGITNTALAILGPYVERLSNRTGRITLEKPEAPDVGDNTVGWVTVDEVVYFDRDPWPRAADGGGSSLQLINPTLPGNNPAAWTALAPTPGSATPGFDTDGDGMPDAWETTNGLDPNDPTDAHDDNDLDGATNLEEHLAGTDPDDADSVLRARLAAPENGDAWELSLTWPGVEGVRYGVEGREHLDSGDWMSLTNLPALPANQTLEYKTYSTNANSGYLRVKVLP